MLKLQSAPPRRVINWYRVAARAVVGLIVLGVIACAVFAFPYEVSYLMNPDAGRSYELIAADGYGFGFQVIGFIGLMALCLAGLALLALALWLLWKVLVVVGVLIDWYAGKMREHDRKAKEYSGYHD